jgi:hypothetical protein
VPLHPQNKKSQLHDANMSLEIVQDEEGTSTCGSTWIWIHRSASLFWPDSDLEIPVCKYFHPQVKPL